MQLILPATFRGIPFHVDMASGTNGRRVAVHEYPGRDAPWIEDMGQSMRIGVLDGFVLGDFAEAEMQLLRLAAEKPGEAIMTHPTRGLLKVTLIAPMRWTTRKDALGRYNFSLQFVEGSIKIFGVGLDTITALASSAVSLGLGGAKGFVSAVNSVIGTNLSLGSAQITNTGSTFATMAARSVIDAAAIAGAVVAAVPPVQAITTGTQTLGRYASGGLTVRSLPTSVPATITEAISDAIMAMKQSLSAVTSAAASIPAPTELLAYATSMQTLIRAVAAVPADPLDAVRVLAGLTTYTPPAGSGAPAIACAAMCRRSTLAQLCAEVPLVTYYSSTDAIAALTYVTGLLDAEIDTAAAAFEDAVVKALRSTRGLIVQSLTQQGADLAPLVTRTFAQSLPASVVAQRLYRDGTRADEIVRRVNPIHPSFLPVSMTVLAR